MSFYYTLYTDNCLITLYMHEVLSWSESNGKYSKQSIKKHLDNYTKENFLKNWISGKNMFPLMHYHHFNFSYGRSASFQKKKVFILLDFYFSQVLVVRPKLTTDTTFMRMILSITWIWKKCQKLKRWFGVFRKWLCSVLHVKEDEKKMKCEL